jgi:hypothetical protein
LRVVLAPSEIANAFDVLAGADRRRRGQMIERRRRFEEVPPTALQGIVLAWAMI